MTTLTYRYKLDETVLHQLQGFAEEHRHASPAVFREAWKIWLVENAELVTRERNRLKTIGCAKKAEDKMYKSARYYFKNKSQEENEPTKRREYVGTSKQFREAIDEHIVNVARKQELKPSAAYLNFIENPTSAQILSETRTDIGGYGFTDEMVEKKIKKTYKNRYFAHQKA